MNSASTRGMRWISVLLLVIPWIMSGCGTTEQPGGIATGPTATYDRPPGTADDLVVVDCLLPGQVRKLGSMTYMSPRRPMKTTALDCEIRGGEYVAYDRSNYRTALNAWMAQAETGDQTAQTYVGEIYLKGIGGVPQYAEAAKWFEMAANQGNERARMNLGYLYEKGLGVPKDPLKAVALYRKATGLKDAVKLESSEGMDHGGEAARLRDELNARDRQIEDLRNQLLSSRYQSDLLRMEFEDKKKEIADQKRRLEQDRLVLESRKKAASKAHRLELAAMEKEITDRRSMLAEQQREADRLKKEVARLNNETGKVKQKMETFRKRTRNFSSPKITLIDPLPESTRGIKLVKAQGGQKERVVIGRVAAPAGVFSFHVNGKEEFLKPNGMFKFSVPVDRVNETKVTITAVDTQGKRGDMAFTISPEEGGKSSMKRRPAVELGAYHALLIGNNDYEHLPRLATPANDVKQIEALLRNRYGFHTRTLFNATRFQIYTALDEIRRKLTEKDNFLIYYAGHGELDKTNNRGYWMPVDASAESHVNSIPNYTITDILNIMSVKQALVIADTCYSGILTRSAVGAYEKAGMSKERRLEWLRTLIKEKSRTVLTSGGLKPVLDSGGGRHSVFAGALIDILDANTEILEAGALHRKVGAIVTHSSKRIGYPQVPQYAANLHAGHVSGDFLFVPKASLPSLVLSNSGLVPTGKETAPLLTLVYSRR